MNAIEESLKIMKEAINKPIINEVQLPTIYSYGINGPGSCEICDNEINEMNPGKEINYTENGQKHIVHTCNNCFRETDYLEIISKKENLKIKPYEY